jgi:glycerate-2-kinase
MNQFPIVKDLVREILMTLDPNLNFRDILASKGCYLTVKGEKFLVTGRLHVFALGKAASFQVQAFLNLISNSPNDFKLGEIVSYTKDEHTVNDGSFMEFEGSHPVISERNIKNTLIYIEKLSEISLDDTLVFLLSGGGSSLLELPIKGLSFEDLHSEHEKLLESGLNINDMNKRRKELSQVKNGGLLKFLNTRNIIQFVTCDIPNEKIEDISSGPLMSDEDNFDNPRTYMLNSGSRLLENLCSGKTDRIMGKIYDCSIDVAINDLMQRLPNRGEKLFTGGEIPIMVTSKSGKGGRNTHFVLAFAERLYKDDANRDIKILSIGTDGGDGPTDAAGAYIDFDLFKNNNHEEYLATFNSYEYFEKIGTLIKTGPTKTNVMDLRCIWRD